MINSVKSRNQVKQAKQSDKTSVSGINNVRTDFEYSCLCGKERAVGRLDRWKQSTAIKVRMKLGVDNSLQGEEF